MNEHKQTMKEIKTPKTLLQAVAYFTDDAKCVEFLSNFRWADGKPHCPKCGSDNVCSLTSRPAYRCREKGCRKSFSLKTGSVMEDSPLPITKWVPALWFIINHKNGVSSCEVARALGITQKSAWHLCHRIRKAVSNGSFEKLSGNIEVDETYVGGKAQFMHKERRAKLSKHNDPKRNVANDKTVVMGILERGGEVRVKVVENARRTNLLPEIVANVEAGSNIYSDKLRSYDVLKENYNHSSVDHNIMFVDGATHTNGLENFWCLFKRSVKGTYTQIAKVHTNRYLAEQAFRYNTRKMNDAERFEQAAAKLWGKRLPYAELIGRKAA